MCRGKEIYVQIFARKLYPECLICCGGFLGTLNDARLVCVSTWVWGQRKGIDNVKGDKQERQKKLDRIG